MKLKRFPLEKHEDERGVLLQNEINSLFDKAEHFLITFSKPGVVRGNHYHKRKREWFLIFKGKAELHVMDMDSKEKTKYIVDSKIPEIIEMPPNVAHAFKCVGNGEMIFLGFVNEQFDETDPDTYDYKLI